MKDRELVLWILVILVIVLTVFNNYTIHKLANNGIIGAENQQKTMMILEETIETQEELYLTQSIIIDTQLLLLDIIKELENTNIITLEGI